MSGKIRTVVLADSHVVLRIGVRRLLESTGQYEILDSVGEAVDTVRAIAERQPDIAVVGLAFPDISATQFLAELKLAAPRTKIVIYTFIRGERLCMDALSCGVDAIVFKTDREEQLLAALAAVSVGRSFVSPAVTDSLLSRPRSALSITPREQEVVRLIALGMSNDRVAQTLHLSPKTIEAHRANAGNKANCRNTAELVRYALRNELVAA